MIQLDPPQAEEHLRLEKKFFLIVVRESDSGLRPESDSY